MDTLSYMHEMNTIHKDIKPQNVLFNLKKKKLKIIDFGLSKAHVPGDKQNTRVCSLFYKAPELLLNYQLYDYAIDIWAAGIIFASLVS